MPFSTPVGITAWLVHAYHGGMAGVTAGLHAVSRHTGIPVVVVAALVLVLSYRVIRRGARLALEVGVVVAVLLVATKLGWIHW
jgi:hypothetical protein